MITLKTCRKKWSSFEIILIFSAPLSISRGHECFTIFFKTLLEKVLKKTYSLNMFMLHTAKCAKCLGKEFSPLFFQKKHLCLQKVGEGQNTTTPLKFRSTSLEWSETLLNCFDPRVHMLDTFSRPSAVSQNFLRRSPSPPYLEDHPT